MEGGVSLPTRGQRALAAIVVTDAVGFSARMSVDEETTLGLIHRDLKMMEALCEESEGQVLKSLGDGLLMYFVSAAQAVACAIEIQKRFNEAAQATSVEQVLLHRIGIHLGDVFFNQADAMGNGVNIAARLQAQADPGGICMSKIVYDVVKSRLALKATYMGPLQLKNIQELVPAYQIPPLMPQGSVYQESAKPVSGGGTAFEQREIPAGMVVGGRYKIQRLLGQGGFGRSYLVEDIQRFGEASVLKEFVPMHRSQHVLQKAMNLFKREAKTLYQIDHPQIPKFLACFTQAQRLFIVQEYVNGTTYSQLLRQRQHRGERFSEAEVVQWLRDMLRVLDYLHGLNIIHRDISPDNVMFSRDRSLPVLIDFGLVNDAITCIWSEGADPDEPEAIRQASLVGKLGYSPPEQLRLGQCYPCSDLYALGVTALVLLTGKYPTALMNQETLEWRWRNYVTPSRPLAQMLDRLLMPKPRDRYQSAQEVLQVLETLPALSHVASDPLLVPSHAVDPEWRDRAPADSTSVNSGAKLIVTSDPAFIDQCRQELARCVGPMAHLIVDDTLTQYPEITPEGFVETLASQISSSGQATEFKSRIALSSMRSQVQAASVLQSEPQTMSNPQGRPGSTLTEPPTPAQLNAVFLDRCRQELARAIGPMAGFLVEEALADYPNISLQGLVEVLMAEIPDARQAAEFRQRLGYR